MTEIKAILGRLAVDGESDPQHGWEIRTSSVFTRVMASTADTYPAPAEAVDAALALRQALLDAGLEEIPTCRVGATTDHAGEEGWRGTIDLVFRP
ncbi:hypothetical protein ACQHIV_11750 [Kribbella sp. GL6]|uniref:hypothetical protein n=1 Tax=Kribbella sp. GL6 TaxID=3419765 RepID=UPI003CFBF483